MGAPIVFSGNFAKLLSQSGLLRSDGSLSQNDGIKNYISNGHAEINTNGWATYADGAAVPVDGTGGSPTATFTRSTSSPLRGSASFLYTSGALGNGVSYAFTIDAADQAKSLQISFDYDVTGTTSLGDYTVYVYDVTNGVMTQVIPYQIQGGVSTTQYSFKGTYQTASNSTSHRLVINQAVSSPGGNLKFDNVYIGPQGVSYTSPMSDWMAYTPTIAGFGTTSGVQFWSRRVGDSLQVRGNFTAGTPTASANSITIGYGGANANVSIDTSKSQNTALVGTATGSLFNTTQFGWTVLAGNTNTVSLGIQTSTIAGTTASGNGSTVASNGMLVEVSFEVPISGWSSSAAISQSDGSEGRVVAARLTNTAGTTVGTSLTVIPFATSLFDTHSAWSQANNYYVVPVTGYYRVTAKLLTASVTLTTAQTFNCEIWKNGSNYSDLFRSIGNGASQFYPAGSSDIIQCTAGDTIQVKAVGGVSVTLFSSAGYNYIDIERISGNQSILASETVAMGAYKISGSHTSSASWQDLTSFDSVQKDSHNSFNASTGVYTISTPGTYSISGTVTFTSNTTGIRGIRVQKNGSTNVGIGAVISAGANSGDTCPTCMGNIPLLAGDTIKLQAYQNSGGTLAYDTGTDVSTRINIHRIGN